MDVNQVSDDPRSPTNGTNLLIEDVLGKIRDHGYALRDTYGERQPNPWTYTIGFTGLNHPEFVFYNLPRPVVEGITSRMYTAVVNGHTFQGGDMVDRIIPGFPLAVLAIPHGYPWPVAADIYGLFAVRGLLVVSPDLRSRFPWDPGSDIANQEVPPQPAEWNEYDLI